MTLGSKAALSKTQCLKKQSFGCNRFVTAWMMLDG
jgi:hypothetical protein